jgi:hypothetical protein
VVAAEGVIGEEEGHPNETPSILGEGGRPMPDDTNEGTEKTGPNGPYLPAKVFDEKATTGGGTGQTVNITSNK